MKLCRAMILFVTISILLLLKANASATPTENLGIRVLRAPGKVVVDGKTDDWDLTGGVFACDDVENQREHFGAWLHAMYDADNLYVLAHFVDETPLNNPGQTIADYGFAGDCLQFRTITAPGTPKERGQHFTCWKGHDGADVIKIEQGKDFKEGIVVDAKKTDGAQQAFTIDADGKGYIQEIAIPWKLLTRDGQALRAGDTFTITFEPNFTINSKSRLSIKDVFKRGATPDRVFTFMATNCWGTATLEPVGHVSSAPVRLADAREFATRLDAGALTVDWTGLIKTAELPGFLPISFEMPFDGYISLNIRNADGQVVRQLLNAAFFTKGKHEVKWDGLTNWSWTRPGEPTPLGKYTWSALVHTGIGLKLRGWACNGGATPWDSADGHGNWGGDHGAPSAVAVDEQHVFLAWSAAEAGKAVLACDLNGGIQWTNNRGGIAGAHGLAADAGVVYILGGMAGPDSDGASIYKLNAKDGSYVKWDGTDSADLAIKSLWPASAAVKPERADWIAAADGKMFLSFTSCNLIAVVDGHSGKLLNSISVKSPGCIAVKANVLYYVDDAGHVAKLSPAENPDPNAPLRKTVAMDAPAVCFALNQSSIFEAFGDPLNSVAGYPDADQIGAKIVEIGRKGGRALLGPWQPDGMRFIKGMAIDAAGKLWVVESDAVPKRVSVWDIKTGKLLREFFGGTAYGALGGAISPLDPNVMVGQGCEWQLDPKTGQSRCVGVITRDGMENSRFGVGANGKLYLAVAARWAFEPGWVNIFERLGPGEYKLRAKISYVDNDGKAPSPGADGKTAAPTKTAIWSDENGDGEKQPGEVTLVDGLIRISGWYMGMTPDLTFYSPKGEFKVTGFTACGAPKYDFAHPIKLPIAGLGSADGKFVMQNGEYGVTHGVNHCYEIASGKLLWTYPDNFVGVHGSHNACPPTVGMIRGSFGPCGVAKFPAPIGNVWVIPTNVGEWHILTEDGFYLTRLFEGDPLKVKWPDTALPGVDMSRCPPGMGGEDFGGSISQGADGKLYVEAGKTAFWNMEVTGLESVKGLQGGSLEITTDDVAKARAVGEQQLQMAVGKRQATIHKFTPKFTGNLDQDFKGEEIIKYQKGDDTPVSSSAAWDDENLYLAWNVHDATPWINGAEEPENLYLSGDTVDFQLGADPKSDPARDKAALHDLRLSIGNFKGHDSAVLYRPVSRDKHPRTFSSGVVKEYKVDSVQALDNATIKVTRRGDGYTVEAAIPLKSLDLTLTVGTTLHGDFGVTYGDPAGHRTRLRSYWSNQHTGIVDDAVFELMMEPRNWGEIQFVQ